MSEVNINLGDLSFREAGSKDDPSSRLVASVTINGVPHHLEAVAIRLDEIDGQVGVNEECEEILSDLYVCHPSDTPFNTVEYRERQYVFCMAPSS